ncbi:helix-turn-helix domain-containing protein [Litoreibacter albidus]|uniref:Transcriptional regulator, XRE family n=1 Tax=Litoreibacter albidus TaxID=670155 RepID=A0A1H2YA53_9RHOB|nr:helix-turn-helix domain-containing protein [Litoreibacter albidus]SDX02122.1 transcriptional regulator, XRE family [Litoreibacter albidus]
MHDDDTYFSNDNATFGDRVAAARDAQGLSQEELAKKLGVKLKTIRGWEDDVDEPRANRLSMLSGILNVSMRWLLTAEGEGLNSPAGEVELTGDVKDILLELRRTKAEFSRLSDHLGRLEKKLGKLLRAPE